ncbi:MAG: DMT family transporter [Granulosicoccus sp.]
MSTTALLGYTNTDKQGAFAVTAGAAVWGLFWIPLRYLNDTGIGGLWAVALVTAMATVPAIAVMLWKRESGELLKKDTWLLGMVLGLATVLYFVGVLYSDVIRVIFLFYLLPLWTTLSARIIYNEPITRAQLLVISAALCGLWLLLGAGSTLPVPQNLGDWCGLGAGFCWGISLSLLRGRTESLPFSSCATTLIAALIVALLFAIGLNQLVDDDQLSIAVPTIAELTNVWLIAMVFGAAVLYPAMISQVWGARRIPAPTAALLTMTEIIVATLSAGLLIGTELEPVSIIGGVIIVLAVCIDLITRKN